MKIIEGDEDILSVWYEEDFDEIRMTDHNKYTLYFTPLEAVKLRDIFSRLIEKTKYFKGFSYPEKQENSI